MVCPPSITTLRLTKRVKGEGRTRTAATDAALRAANRQAQKDFDDWRDAYSCGSCSKLAIQGIHQGFVVSGPTFVRARPPLYEAYAETIWDGEIKCMSAWTWWRRVKSLKNKKANAVLNRYLKNMEKRSLKTKKTHDR